MTETNVGYKVKLEVFEGPLDLLLHLIKKEEVDIYDIPISKILDQYMECLEIMKMLDLEVAGEFLVMASTLMLIKSKMLLPPPPKEADEEEEDPRMDLVKQLLEYKKYKEAASYFQNLEGEQKNIYTRVINTDNIPIDEKEAFEVSLFDLISAFSKVLKRTTQQVFEEIVKEEISIEDRIADILEALKQTPKLPFESLFEAARSKLYVVVTFLALLELIRIGEVSAMQEREFEGIFLVQKTGDR